MGVEKNSFMKGKSPQDTKEKFEEHYIESAHSINLVCKFLQCFRGGNLTTSEAESFGLLGYINVEKTFEHEKDVSEMGAPLLTKKVYSCFSRLHSIYCHRFVTVDEKSIDY